MGRTKVKKWKVRIIRVTDRFVRFLYLAYFFIIMFYFTDNLVGGKVQAYEYFCAYICFAGLFPVCIYISLLMSFQQTMKKYEFKSMDMKLDAPGSSGINIFVKHESVGKREANVTLRRINKGEIDICLTEMAKKVLNESELGAVINHEIAHAKRDFPAWFIIREGLWIYVIIFTLFFSVHSLYLSEFFPVIISVACGVFFYLIRKQSQRFSEYSADAFSAYEDGQCFHLVSALDKLDSNNGTKDAFFIAGWYTLREKTIIAAGKFLASVIMGHPLTEYRIRLLNWLEK